MTLSFFICKICILNNNLLFIDILHHFRCFISNRLAVKGSKRNYDHLPWTYPTSLLAIENSALNTTGN